MKFTEHQDWTVLTIKNYQPGSVKINDQILETSFYMTQKELFREWQCDTIEALTIEKLDDLLAKNPEVIILGTGDQQAFPAPQLFAHCASQGVGLEVMANDAACRTYNILTTEDRDIVLALMVKKVSA